MLKAVFIFTLVFGSLVNAATMTRDTFFSDQKLYYVHITGWSFPPDATTDQAKVASVVRWLKSSNPVDEQALANQGKNSKIQIQDITSFAQDGSSPACPTAQVQKQTALYQGGNFDIGLSGNLTNGTPKSSYKIDLSDSFAGQETLDLKSMWNDPSQQREALIWKMFKQVKMPFSSGHTYARFCINDTYFGLFSIIEVVDKNYLKAQLPGKTGGNLYKANDPGDIGAATLAYRKSPASLDDSGKWYFKPGSKFADRTYSLKTNNKKKDDPRLQSYDDLATFVRVTQDTKSPDYEAKVRGIFDVDSFLRWAALNSLIGSWDCYWLSPTNFYLYNVGAAGQSGVGIVTSPYFYWVPWDYDNTFGISYEGTHWDSRDIIPSATDGKNSANLPLLTALLSNKTFMKYYLSQMSSMLNNVYRSDLISNQMKSNWNMISDSVYMEASQENAASSTGRQFTNHEVWFQSAPENNGPANDNALNRGGKYRIEGIGHFVSLRSTFVKNRIAQICAGIGGCQN